MKSGRDNDTFNNLTTDYNMEHNIEANEQAKELLRKFLSEGLEMEEALQKAQNYCVHMTGADKENSMFWAMTGIYITIASYRLDGYDI